MEVNSDDVLNIDGNGRITPSGPLQLDADEEVIRLYAWVIQARADGTAAICAAFQEDFPSRTEWTARADAVHEGVFSAGQAFAMAVMVSRRGRVGREAGEPSSRWRLLGTPEDPTRAYWWSEMIILAKL